jgi:hypothetical protein
LPVPDAPEVIVMKLALLCAVHEHVEAAVTAIVPVVAAELTLVVVLPSVTEQLLAAVDGDVSLLEQAAAASAAAPAAANVSNRRGRVISRSF